MNVGQVLRQGALRHPDRCAAVQVGHTEAPRKQCSYAELDAGARHVAAALLAQGAAPGDRVALLARNGLALVETWFGIVYAGCTVLPLPAASAPAELRHRVTHAGCRFLVHDAEAASRVAAVRDDTQVVPLHIERLKEACLTPLVRPAACRPEAAAMILYTSGTTGQPKGAVITHASLLVHTATLVHHVLRLGPDDVVWGGLPLAHSYGVRMVLLSGFFAGARCVLMPRFDARAALDVLASEGVTWLPAVPTMLAAWARLDEGPELPALRWCLSAGAPLASDIARQAEQRLGVEVRQGYGMTEATFSSIDAPPLPRVTASVGKPVWGVEVRITDAEGRELPAGSDGEIQVRGPNVMASYLDDPDATAEVLRDGWMRTGDLGHLDTEGRLFVVDRLKDMIIRGGHNVYPSEVEEALCDHSAVAEAAVVGRPDAYYGEEVVAVLVLRSGHSLTGAELARFLRERVARTKLPRELVILDALPQGASGKVHKRALREQIASGTLRPLPLESYVGTT